MHQTGWGPSNWYIRNFPTYAEVDLDGDVDMVVDIDRDGDVNMDADASTPER